MPVVRPEWTASPRKSSWRGRRESQLITPIPKPRKRGGKDEQRELEFGAQGLSDSDRQYEVTQQINSIRALVEEWRLAPESQWKVSAETARLLKHLRHHEFQGIRPFYCQIEAAETAIWLTEVAPENRDYYAGGRKMNEFNDRLNRLMP